MPKQRSVRVPDPGLPDVLDAEEAARSAGLRYVSDAMPGIRRTRAGKSFRYVSAEGSRITDPEELARIRALAVPPAWTDVWICPHPRGHIQATGRDARGRKQYRYHPEWRRARDETKYGRLIEFGESLATVRSKVGEDLARPGLCREKVVASIIHLLDTTFMRVGNESYAKANNSFGLTTLRVKHVAIDGSAVRLEFKGKSGKTHAVDVEDARVARIIKRCRELPGQELFQYLDEDGERHTVDSGDINDFLRDAAGEAFTAKDFRTWAGTVLATAVLYGMGEPRSARIAKYNVNRAVELVAAHLGNTPAICRKSYVHPGVIDAYTSGDLLKILTPDAIKRARRGHKGLKIEEAAVLALLKRLARAQAAKARKKSA